MSHIASWSRGPISRSHTDASRRPHFLRIRRARSRAQVRRAGILFLLLLGVGSIPGLTAGAWAAPDPRYAELDSVLARVSAWQQVYPTLIRVESIGTTQLGEPIPAVKISDSAAVHEPEEPALLLHAAQHANEANGTNAILRSMERLLEGYGVDPRRTAFVDGLQIWFVPVANVDGHRYVFSDAFDWSEWRKTMRDNNGDGEHTYPEDGVDMNRNWDWKWTAYPHPNPADPYYKGPLPFSEAEVLALRDFVLREQPVFVGDLHSPVTISWNRIVFFPWMSQSGGEPSPDYDLFQTIAQSWAQATRDRSGNTYSSLYAYDTLPKEQCWVYGKTGICTMVMEISDQCWWTGATVDTIAARVARGFDALYGRVLDGPGLTGTVTSASTGFAIDAEVEIAQAYDPDIGPHRTDRRSGRYWRLLAPGSYTVDVSANGYVSAGTSLVVGSAGWTVADFALEPVVSGSPGPRDPEGSPVGVTSFTLRHSNPLRPGDPIWIEIGPLAGETSTLAPVGGGGEVPGTDRSTVTLELYGPSGNRVARLPAIRIRPGSGNRTRVPEDLPSGAYTLRARRGSEQVAGRLIVVR